MFGTHEVNKKRKMQQSKLAGKMGKRENLIRENVYKVREKQNQTEQNG